MIFRDCKRFTVVTAQGIAEVQLPAVTHRVYLDVEIDGQHIGMSQFIHRSLGMSRKLLVNNNLFTCVVASFVTQLNLNYPVALMLDLPLFVGRIVIGLYGEVVPKTVGILMLFLLFHHTHLLISIFKDMYA